MEKYLEIMELIKARVSLGTLTPESALTILRTKHNQLQGE